MAAQKNKSTSIKKARRKAWNKGLVKVKFELPVELKERIASIAHEAGLPWWRTLNILLEKAIILSDDADEQTVKALAADIKTDYPRIEKALIRLNLPTTQLNRLLFELFASLQRKEEKMPLN